MSGVEDPPSLSAKRSQWNKNQQKKNWQDKNGGDTSSAKMSQQNKNQQNKNWWGYLGVRWWRTLQV